MRLLSVHDVGWAMATGERFDSARHRAETYLAGVKTGLELRGTPVTAVVRDGYVVHEILREAEAWGTDLVVLATHGRGGLSRFWLGSVADQCIRRAHRPVLLLRSAEPNQPDGPAPFTVPRIVVPVDRSELSEAALGSAVAVASLFNAAVTLVHVIDARAVSENALLTEPLESDHLLLKARREGALAYLEGLAAFLRSQGVETATRVIIHTSPGAAIVAEAGGDLVVMATHARAGLSRVFLGSVADQVVRGAIGPVLVVPPETTVGPCPHAPSSRSTRCCHSSSAPSPGRACHPGSSSSSVPR